MIRYLPPKGTAGLARSRVSGCSLLPSPPAMTIANVLIATPRFNQLLIWRSLSRRNFCISSIQNEKTLENEPSEP